MIMSVLSSCHSWYTATTKRYNHCRGAKNVYLLCMQVHVQHTCRIHTSVCAHGAQRLTWVSYSTVVNLVR
ncbi:rCG25412 [Rattus norvegicus]|uniref:RCG25412 n=1 Tax=Rattus norvegicus TaxID=10116 RepID=A6I3R4_RAT|nr:rCG25412 [Rattus norvegicus]